MGARNSQMRSELEQPSFFEDQTSGILQTKLNFTHFVIIEETFNILF